MIYFIIGILLFTAFAFLSIYTTKEEHEWTWIINITLVIFIVAFIAQSIRDDSKYHTEIIRRYQQGDYQLELTVDGDKIDTLYIFK